MARGDAYEVGYARPPKQHQFRKGQSGNPKGRPAKKPDVYDALIKVLQRPVSLDQGGETIRVTMRQALLLKLRQLALGGHAWANKLTLRIVASAPDVSADPALDGGTARLKLAILIGVTTLEAEESRLDELEGRGHG